MANEIKGLVNLTTGEEVANADSRYELAGAISTHASTRTGVHGISITADKTFSCTGNLTLSGTDGSTLNIGGGGTLGTGAFASVYSHPTGDGNLHVPANSTNSLGKVLTAGATAGLYTWETPAASGVSKWTEFTGFTTAPGPGSYIYLNDADSSGIFKSGTPLRYTIGGVVYYGISSGVLYDDTNYRLNVRGASPVSGTITKLEYGLQCLVVQVEFPITGVYGNGTDTDLLYNDMGYKFIWKLGKAYCVRITAAQKVVDTGAEPKVNLLINGQRVSINDSNLGIQLTTAGTVVENVANALNTSYYDVNDGEAVTVECTAAGGTGDAAHLTMSAVFILE